MLKRHNLLPLCLVLGVMLLAGCTWPSVSWNQPEPVVVEDPFAKFQQQSEDLGNVIELESQLSNLMAQQVDSQQSVLTYPIASYTTARTKKVFGQYITPDSGDRFSGYHTGDDIEVTDLNVEVPVYALVDAEVVQKQTVSGYGGVMILEFSLDGEIYHVLYGHLDLSSVSVSVGTKLKRGEKFAVLGADRSTETDGERKHLHFGIYPYTGTELYAGYVQDDTNLTNWVNPADFLREHNAVEPS